MSAGRDVLLSEYTDEEREALMDYLEEDCAFKVITDWLILKIEEFEEHRGQVEES